ncbi:MAG: hypothetical protein WCX48_11010 [Bacteroidales bacterium]|jgi:hypothetical protein
MTQKTNKNLGIDKITVLILFLISVGESLIEKLQDKKLSWSERLSLLVDLRPVLEIFRDWREIKDQIVDLQPSELDQIIFVIQNDLNIENEKVKILIDNVLALIRSIIDLIESIALLKTK